MGELYDPVILARMQFAFTVSFHIIFPSFTIGLASFLAVLEALWLIRGKDVYIQLYRYWSKIFALSFGMGVVSGIVLSYQFGTNWGPFADKVGPIVGTLIGYEVMTAFFLEAGFLGVMLFGQKRVGKGLHFFATLMVAFGTLFSTFWILSANSWMQTPQGYEFIDERFIPVDWWAVIFNPSFPYRLIHMVLAAYLTTALVVAAVSAFHLLKDRWNLGARTMLSMAMWLIAIVIPVQLFVGDAHGRNTLQYQPAKIAALEGHWHTEKGAPLILFGWPDMEKEETLYKIEIPHLGSLILTHEWNGELRGLSTWPARDRPNATIIFWSFRIMVGIGVLILLYGMLSLYLRHRQRLYDSKWFLRLGVLMGPVGFVAILAGWVTTEVGRQPYVVYGYLRTDASASPIDAPAVATSLTAFVIVYCLIFGSGILYILRLMAKAPQAEDSGPDPQELHRAAGVTPAAGIARKDEEASS